MVTHEQLHPACHMLGNEMSKVDAFLRVAVVKHLQDLPSDAQVTNLKELTGRFSNQL